MRVPLLKLRAVKQTLGAVVIVALSLQMFFPIIAYGDSSSSGRHNPCGGSPSSRPATTAQVGGVKLDLAATFLADMSDITGAYYDEQRNLIVFVGKKNTTLPQFDKDDLAVAIRAIIFNNKLPAVSIDFIDINNIDAYPNMKVTMYGGIEDTNFGRVLFEADMLLKKLSFGYDENGNEIHSSVPGYQSALKMYVANGPDDSKESASRFWISPKLITIKRDVVTDSFVFDEVVMQVEAEALFTNNDPAWNKAYDDFAAHQTQYYDAFAAEIPSYAKVKQLSKITSVIKWLKDNQIATDYGWAQNYQPRVVPTPREVARITTPYIQGYNVTGGVDFYTKNTYSDETAGMASKLKTDSIAAASSSSDGVSWTFNSNGETYDAVAVSADLLKSAGAYTYSATDASAATVTKAPLEVERAYSSFAVDKNVGFGPGWTFIPATLTDIMPGFVGSCSGTLSSSPFKIAITTPAGRETFTYSACQAAYLPDDPAFHSKLVRNADGTFTVTMKNRSSYTFAKVQSGYLLTGQADANNTQAITWSYNANNTVATLSNVFSNQQINFTYNPQGQIASVSAPSGTTNYTYDAQGDLITASDKKGKTTKYTYSPAHYLKTVTDRAGTRLIDNTYDINGKVIAQTDARGLNRLITYSTSTGSVIWKDALGRTQREVYDDRARLLQSIDPIGATTTYTYGTTSNMPISVTNARGQVVKITYDTLGNPLTVIAPDGGKIQNTWSAASDLMQVADQRYVNAGGTAKVTSYQYDANGNRTQSSIAGITTTTYTYTPQGQVAAVADQMGNKIQFTYNTRGLPVTMQDQLGKTASYTYDDAGHLIKVTDPSGVATFFTYDANGNKLTVSTPAATMSYSYDAADRPVDTTDPIGAKVTFAYDIVGNLASVTDPLGGVLRYTYDVSGNLIKTNDPLARDTSIAYDALNRETSYKTPLGKTWTTSYDVLGNPISVKLPNGSVQATIYDSLNRVVSTKVGTTTLSYTYDSASRLVKVGGPTGTTSYAYDIKDRLIQTTDTYGNIIQYQYDTLDNLTKITYPDGKTIQNEYDAAGRLVKQTDWNGGVTTYTYTPVGSPNTIAYPNGITKSFTYDSANRLASITYTGSAQSILFRQTYQRDARGFVTKISEVGTGGVANTKSYTYDAAGRLTSAIDSLVGATTTYAFDPTGNITNVSAASMSLVLASSTTSLNVFKKAATTTTTILTTGTSTTVTTTITTPLRRGVPAGESTATYATSTATLAPASTTAIKASLATSTATSTSPPTTTTNVTQSYATTTTSTAPTTTDTLSTRTTKVSTTTSVVFNTVTVATTTSTILSQSATVGTTLIAVPKVLTTKSVFSADSELLSSTIFGSTPTTTVVYTYDANGNLLKTTAGTNIKNYSWTALEQLAGTSISSAPPPSSFIYDAAGNRIGKTAGTANIFKEAATTTTTTQKSGNATTIKATVTTQSRDQSSTIVYSTSTSALAPTSTAATKSLIIISSATTTLPEATKTAVSESYATTTAALPTTIETSLRSTITTYATTTTVVLTRNTVATTSRTFMVVGTGSTMRYVNDVSTPNELVLAEMNTSNVASRMNVWGADGLVSTGAPGAAGRLYPLTDAQGTTRLLTDAAGTIVQRYSYSPYGEVVGPLSATTSPYLYTGENFDQETGLEYLRARYYDPATGRFISRDPVRGTLDNPLTQNPYIYAADNPTTYTDPSGLYVFGGCITYCAGAGLYAQGSTCLVFSFPKLGVGVSQNLGGGGVAGIVAGVGVGPTFSNANTIHDLDGPAAFFGGSAKLGVEAGVDTSLSRDSNENLIYSTTATLGIGGAAEPYVVPFEVHGGAEKTYSYTLDDFVEWLSAQQ